MNYTTSTSTTSTIPDRYFKNRYDGYKDGFNWAVKKINERFINWLLFGVLIGYIIGTLASYGAFLLFSVIGLFIFAEKLKDIKIK